VTQIPCGNDKNDKQKGLQGVAGLLRELRCASEAVDGGDAARGIVAGVVEEDATAGFAGEEVGVVLAAGEVVPALVANLHLAGRALMVQGFGEAGAFALREAVIGGEQRFAGDAEVRDA